MAKIWQVAAPLDDISVFSTVKSDGTAEIWSVETGESIERFAVEFDIGGRRLAMVSRDLLVAARYEADGQLAGVRAYDGAGKVVWERVDLKQPQRLSVLPRGHVGIGLEYTSLTILDSAGKTVARVRGASDAFGSSQSDVILVEGKSSWVALQDSPPGVTRHWRRRFESFGLTVGALAERELVISEIGGPLTAFSLDGEKTWRWQNPEGEHVLAITWATAFGCWAGVLWPYKRGGHCVLITLAGGSIETAVDIGDSFGADFTADGRHVVAPRGDRLELLAVPTGEQVWSKG